MTASVRAIAHDCVTLGAQAIVVCALACGMAGRVRADAGAAAVQTEDSIKTRFTIDDLDPESSVPSPQDALKSPLQMGYWVMLVSDRAEAATKRGDLAAAAKYYRAIAKAVPDRTVAFKKLCATYEAMGDWKNGVASCQEVLSKGGVTVDDNVHFVRLMLSKEGALVTPEIAAIDAVIGHLHDELAKEAASADPTPKRNHPVFIAEKLKCELGLRLEDAKRLESCTKALAQIAPTDPSATLFGFGLALMKHDFDGARRLIAAAKQHGVNDDGVSMLRQRLAAELDRASLIHRLFGNPRALGITAALVAVAILGGLSARRKFRLRAA